jgi:uncharacterized protein
MPNKLVYETSPYLLQHANNPVNWVPWSDEAFCEAELQNKLIFLSIGYSTCHWCHVMEHESFENDKISSIMNEHFINVKVDREENPDIDATYMAFILASTGQGGWPMSVWLTPDGHPLIGGTYFPPEDRQGRVGFPRVCLEVANLWQNNKEKLRENSRQIIEQLRAEAAEPTSHSENMASEKVFEDFIDYCAQQFDESNGGFSSSPKFPRPSILRTLMQLTERFSIDSEKGAMAWRMTDFTLTAMINGGIHDHLAGGFHRYSVDRYWHIPHYEKMLCDQAQLAHAYLDAWQISQKLLYKQAVESILHYVISTMTDDHGAFHAAEDADSFPSSNSNHKREGAFWTWKSSEISAILDPKSAAIFSIAYGIKAEGNARPESDPHKELIGENTLYRVYTDQELAEKFDFSENEIQKNIRESKDKLLQHRLTRPFPHRDNKMITAWNGLMISAIARSARILNSEKLQTSAVNAMKFMKNSSWNGRNLRRSFCIKPSEQLAFPADYVFIISALIELYFLEPKEHWLNWARELQSSLDKNFWSDSYQGYISSTTLRNKSLLTIREDYDGAEPSANHVATKNLLKLSVILQDPLYKERAEKLLLAGKNLLEKDSFAAPVLLAALDVNQRGVMKFEFKGETRQEIYSRYYPRAVFTYSEGLSSITICEGSSCRLFSI